MIDRPPSPAALTAFATALAITVVLVLQVGGQSASAAAGDVHITALNCDSSPEYVRIKNFGGSSQSLTGFHIQSDPSQDYDLAVHVASISAGQTLEFQSGTGSADNPGAGIYKLTGSNIYRNGDTTDYARLVRPGTSSQTVNCGSTPVTPGPTSPPATFTPPPPPTATPTPTPTFPPGTRLQGDVDCNLAVNSVDALKELRFVAGLGVSQPEGCPAIGSAGGNIWGDVDCNGVVNSVDALKVLRHVAGLNVSQDEPCPNIGTPT